MFDFIEQGIYQLSVKYYFTNPEMEGENIVRYKIVYTDNTDDDGIILYTQRGDRIFFYLKSIYLFNTGQLNFWHYIEE